jgi:hypothetical protein
MSVLLCHGPNKAFLVPDSGRATERNRNNLAGVLDFLILQDKHNIHTLSFKNQINLHSLRNSLENLTKGLLFFLFLYLVHINLYFPTMYVYCILLLYNFIAIHFTRFPTKNAKLCKEWFNSKTKIIYLLRPKIVRNIGYDVQQSSHLT